MIINKKKFIKFIKLTKCKIKKNKIQIYNKNNKNKITNINKKFKKIS